MRVYSETMVERLHLHEKSLVIEIASNDGYLLQYFVEKRIAVLGIEPAANVAQVGLQKNIPTVVKFFGIRTAQELLAENGQADFLIGNNDSTRSALNDFVAGMKILLKPTGVITLEFPHLMRLMRNAVRHDLSRAFFLFFLHYC